MIPECTSSTMKLLSWSTKMTIKELHEASGLSIKAFAEYLNIPYGTMQKWLSGERPETSYITELIEYKLRKEGLI